MRWRGANFRSCSAATAPALRCRPAISIAAREALAATAIWVEESLNLVMRVALVPVAAMRAQGLDVRVARFGPSPNLSYAMFSGGGLGWAEAAMKRGEFAVPAAHPGTQPDLSGLVLPVRGNPLGARAHPVGAGGAGAAAPIRAPSAR